MQTKAGCGALLKPALPTPSVGRGLTRVIVRGRGLDLAAMMTYEQPVTFQLLRSIFQCPMRVTHERNTGTWHVDLDAGEPLYEWPDHIDTNDDSEHCE